jgi:hypothetical protein
MSDLRDSFEPDLPEEIDGIAEPSEQDLDDADELFGEAPFGDELTPDTLAGDDDYDAIEETVAEDPKDL